MTWFTEKVSDHRDPLGALTIQSFWPAIVYIASSRMYVNNIPDDAAM